VGATKKYAMGNRVKMQIHKKESNENFQLNFSLIFYVYLRKSKKLNSRSLP
jgi:hypothetical protein